MKKRPLAARLVGLLDAAGRPGLYAVLTMRSEFSAYARATTSPRPVNRTQYLLPRMEHDDLMRAIRELAVLYDGRGDARARRAPRSWTAAVDGIGCR